MKFPKILDRFVLGNFLTLFAGTFIISLFVVMMQFLWKYIDDLVGKGLGVDVLAQFFFYAAETLVPMALPLAVLLASLIAFGNMGERLELLAIKAAGVSLIRTMAPIIILMTVTTGVSYYFQDVVAPNAQSQLMQLLYSMRQKSPELDIPEGVFYDGVEGMNLYVREKDKESGMLRGVIIYNMRDGVNNAHIILSDSARLESSADKTHLLLHLYNGEQFENLSSNALRTQDVPYRRETFVAKHFIIDFDQNFDVADVDFSNSARTKDFSLLLTGIDSLEHLVDSTAHEYYRDMKNGALYVNRPSQPVDSAAFTALAQEEENLDTIFARLSPVQMQSITQQAMQTTSLALSDMEWKVDEMKVDTRNLRMHRIQIWQKITLALACLVFFFIGAPLGAIIRKGGLGMPVVLAVVIFIFYYIINSLGYNLAYAGSIPPFVGMWTSTVVLAPIGAFLTIKSNNDSTVFNPDSYTQFFRRFLGRRVKRHIMRKEVIINDPDYAEMAVQTLQLATLAHDCRAERHLNRLPNYIDIFFRPQRDPEVEAIARQMEQCVEVLGNSRDRHILAHINALPVITPDTHVAPFNLRALNVAAGILLPLGVILYIRIVRMRRRLNKDLKQTQQICKKLSNLCEELI